MCPLTECGFIRISSNPRAIADAVSPVEARVLLEGATARESHAFWPDDLPATDVLHIPWDRMRGHQQVTDAYLLGLSMRRGGRLATFDRGPAALAAAGGQAAGVEVIPI